VLDEKVFDGLGGRSLGCGVVLCCAVLCRSVPLAAFFRDGFGAG
jgi:hypothetical protein